MEWMCDPPGGLISSSIPLHPARSGCTVEIGLISRADFLGRGRVSKIAGTLQEVAQERSSCGAGWASGNANHWRQLAAGGSATPLLSHLVHELATSQR